MIHSWQRIAYSGSALKQVRERGSEGRAKVRQGKQTHLKVKQKGMT